MSGRASHSQRRVAGALLAPGAGTSAEHPSLVSLADAIATELSVPAHRMDFPYRKAGRRAPDRTPVLVEAVKTEAVELAERVGTTTARLVLGGRSMGGRMCSMAVAEGLPVAALVLVCYPLHPPGKPDKLRVEHFPGITVPCLFVSGTRDAFATPDELTVHTAAIAGPVTHVWIERADHSLSKRESEVAAAAVDWLRSLPSVSAAGRSVGLRSSSSRPAVSG